MTPPCDIELQLVSTQNGPFFRLDYFASPEGCVFFEDGSDWFSDAVGEVRITNTSQHPMTVYYSSRGSLRPVSSYELDLPDRVSHWKTGPRRGPKAEQLEAVVLPGMVWKSNATKILNPMVGLAIKNRRPVGRGFIPVELVKPRAFAVFTKFNANIVQTSAQHAVNVDLKSVLKISYFPEEDPNDK